MKHSTTAQAHAVTRILLTAAILIVLNFIAIRLFTRIDLTDQKVFTLSDASIDLVENLDDRVTVRAYFTEDLPAPYNNTRRAVLDILNEYRAYAGDHVEFEFINPVGEQGEQDARQQGIPAVEVQVVEEDKFQVKRAHLGIVFLYEDRKEVIPVVQNLGSLEYDISSAVKRLTTRVKKRVGYTTGHGEAQTQQYGRAFQELTKQYDLLPVDLTKDEPIPDDVAALMVVAPTAAFSDTAQYHLDQYLMGGGRIAFLLNKMQVDLNQQYRFAQEVTIGLDEQLQQYGIRVNADLVRDQQCANITVMQQQGMFQFQSQVPFPYLPNTSDFGDNPMVKDFQSLIFYFASSVDTSYASAKGLSAEVLVRSSGKSGRASGFVMIDPFQKWQPTDYTESGIPVAAVVKGSFSSYFEGKPRTPQRTVSPETRIVVVGDGDFMRDDMAGSRNNATFFVNIVDYLADDAGLITIRSKNIAQPPLDQVEDGTKQIIKYANLLLPPFLIIGYGLMRWRRRVSMKRSLETGV